MKCSICERKSDGRFCEYHQLAYKNVKEAYEKWKEAAEVSWIEYLNEIVNNPLTGEWSKEVARELMRENSNEAGER